MRTALQRSTIAFLAVVSMSPVLAAAAATPAQKASAATTNTDAAIEQGYTAQDGDSLVSSIIGAHVYSSAAAGADDFGAIADVVLDQNGDVQVVILGVGGFLGIGQKSVAVNYEDFKVAKGGDGKDRYILRATKAAFAAAPNFSFADAQAKLPAAGVTSTDHPTDTAQTLAPPPGPLDRSNMKPIDISKMKADDFKGIAVVDASGESIGTISDFMLDKSSKIDAVIVDVGGFLGLGSKPVAVGFDLADYATDKNGINYLFLKATKAQLEALPAYDKETYAAQRSKMRFMPK
jgi:sporulation protein YlmC with PRC-barrel domain